MDGHNTPGACRAQKQVAQRTRHTLLTFDLDSPSEWKSVVRMLTVIVRGERLLTQWYIDHGHEIPKQHVLTEGEFKLAQEMVGVLRPLACAISLLEGDAFKGSSVLPYMASPRSS